MRRNRGFTLLELFITLFSLGLVTVIAMAGLESALDRTAQKVSMMDIRRMGGAMEVFRKDYGGYPPGYSSWLRDPSVIWPTMKDARGVPTIVPDLLTEVPSGDGWGIPYYQLTGPDSVFVQPKLQTVTAAHFVLGSFGSDQATAGGTDAGTVALSSMAGGWCQDTPVVSGTPHTHCYQSDIIWADGVFLQAPDGPQRKC